MRWGREETYHWPSAKPVWALTALLVAVLSFMAAMVYEYTEDWTFLQKQYLVEYVSSVSRPWVKAAPYRLVYRIDGKQERLAVNDDFNDPAVLSRKAKLEWQRRTYANADMERWLREAIYEGEKPWELLIGTATKVGWVVLLVGLVFAGPRDYRRMRIRKYGRRTKGPELVRAVEFNRANRSDGIGFMTRERRTVGEWMLRREGGVVRVPRERESSHFMLMGDTGAGKSSLIRQILLQVHERGETAIVYDPALEYTPRQSGTA